jgi:hypothetical protein
MNDNTKSTKKPDVPKELKARWQRLVDKIARIVGVPAVFIMRLDSP